MAGKGKGGNGKGKGKGKPAPRGGANADAALTYKQRLFVHAYLGVANGNATEAARIAGYASPNVEGTRTLAKASIRAAVDARLAEAAMSADEVLARLAEFASADPGDFLAIDAKGNWRLDMAKAKRMDRLRLLKRIKMGQFGPDFELHDPLRALEQLARYHGLARDKPATGAATDAAIDPGLAAEVNEFALRRLAERGGPAFDPPTE